ncbi:MAG TPA: 5-formyltetrahydrofolate cyclo-ligase [Devosia sp.]|nr:5-formyltetrahydrofolate cyclo-ligase [Devosia sp.]
MIDASIEEAKAALRATAHRRRAAIYSGERAGAARAAAEHFHAGVTLAPGEIVAAYWPIRDELDCRPVLTQLVDSGQPVCLPVVLGDELPLELRLWEEGAPLFPSGFGTLAPAETAPVVAPDVVLMPLLGFDKHGTRLGYGGGYYDRTLAMLEKPPRLIGFAFAVQEVDFVPRESHDVPLDGVVTEAGYRSFARNAG